MPNLDDLNLSPLADALIAIASQMLVKADQVIATQPTQRERVMTAVMTAMLSGKQLPLASYDKTPERAARLTDAMIEKINQKD